MKKDSNRNEELFLNRDFDTLYEENKKLMTYVAKKYLWTELDFDDIIGLGDIAFMKCLKSFNPEVAKWSTYFSLVMRGEILKYVRDSKKSMKAISIEDIYIHHKDDSKAIDFIDTIPSDTNIERDIIEKNERIEVLEHLYVLGDIEIKYLELRLQGKSQIQIAKEMGVTQVQVSRILSKALKKIESSRNKKANKDISNKERDSVSNLRSQILQMIDDGFDNESIIQKLGASKNTVRTYRSQHKKSEISNNQPMVNKAEPEQQIESKRNSKLKILCVQGSFGIYTKTDSNKIVVSESYIQQTGIDIKDIPLLIEEFKDVEEIMKI